VTMGVLRNLLCRLRPCFPKTLTTPDVEGASVTQLAENFNRITD
jgi:hypothetical protein